MKHIAWCTDASQQLFPNGKLAPLQNQRTDITTIETITVGMDGAAGWQPVCCGSVSSPKGRVLPVTAHEAPVFCSLVWQSGSVYVG